MIRTDDGTTFHGARIAVVGVGGGGSNVLDAIHDRDLVGVDLIAINTDAQALQRSKAERRFQLGRDLTRGLGAGANPDVGRHAALADRERLAELMHDVDLVFLTVGLGGGTGTGAAPICAEVCREVGALTVGVATLPFGFEGRRRTRTALDGLEALREQVDTLITIPNDRLLALVDEATSMPDAFAKVDEVIVQGVGSVATLVRGAGRINVDFADIRTIMGARGTAVLGVGRGKGAHRTLTAAEAAYGSPLLRDGDLGGARHVLLNITGPADLTLREVRDAATLVQEEADEDVNMIWGWVVDDRLDDEVEITVIATGFDHDEPPSSRPWTTSRPSDTTRKPADPAAYDVPSFFRSAE